MAIDTPPIYSGITYNSAFFPDNATGFTQAQANALYLRKTFPDTATALETFNGMLNYGQITIQDSVADNARMTLKADTGNAEILLDNGSNSTYLNVLGLQATTGSTLNVCTTSNIPLNVGTGTRSTAVVHHYSDGDNAIVGANVHLNNGVSNLSNTAIHNGANSVGAVNIATGTGASTAISIGTNGATATANRIRIGSTTRQTYLDSDSLNMGTNGLTASGAISIATGTNTAGAQVSIGSTSLTALNLKAGQTNLETTTLNLNSNGTGNTLIGTAGGSNSITINRPLTVGYSPSFTSTQIGYSGTASASGTHVNGVNNVYQVPALVGVYIMYCQSYVAASSFVGVTSYNFEMGYYGGSVIARSYLAGTSLNYNNNQQTLTMVYTSSAQQCYGAINLSYASYTGSPIWGLNFYYTRIA